MTAAALGLIGVSQKETLDLFKALAGILQLGQVSLGPWVSGWLTADSRV